MTTIINTKIGESKNVTRIWLEGHKLARAGVRIGGQYTLNCNKDMARVELRETQAAANEQVFTVSKRERRGVVVPLIEVRTQKLREVFENVDRVRVAIRQGRIVITAHHQDVKVAEREKRLIEKMRRGDELEVASFFHGAGVLDRAMHSGLLRSGVKSFVQVGLELEPEYLDCSLRNNQMLWREESIAICSDIRDVNWGRNAPQVDLCWAGIPCTGASKSGRSKNKLSCAEEHSDVGALFVDFLEAVKALNPAVIGIENVPEYQDSASMIVIRSVLSTLGYKLYEGVLHGNDFGALEARRRLVVVAVSRGLDAVFDFNMLKPVRQKENAIKDILEDIPQDSDRWKPYDYLAEKEKRDIAAGKGFKRQLLTGDEAFCGTIGKGYAKARSTEPFIKHKTNPELSRLFTVTEHARVKGIPVEMFAGVSDTVGHELAGQSVVFPMFESVGQLIGEMLVRLSAGVGITSYCQQVCGGGNCGTGKVCQYGIDPVTQMPATEEGRRQLELAA